MQASAKSTTNSLLLFVVLLIAAILRFWNFSEIPFMYDELSALIRAQAGSFSELIIKAKETDVHPVGIPVFVHYWTLLFGKSEMVVKLPFIVFSIVSVYYSYKIAEKWFNATVGLFTSACLATLQFPIMYGQLERPYASGMLFSVLMVWCWTNFLFGEKAKQNRNLTGFVIAASLCTYNHYFSLLFAIIVGLTGLFFVNRQNYLKYILAGICIGLLFVPHIPVFLYHLSLGGVGEDGWLGKPDNDWLYVFLKYLFHFSRIVYALLFFLIAGSLYFLRKQNSSHYKMHIVAIVWGFAPFLIVFFYSVLKSPVLQYSTMTFSLPFLLMSLFSFYPDISRTLKTVLVAAILVTNIFTLVNVRKHYEVFYKQPYEQMAENSLEIINQKGEKNVSVALSVIDGFMDYYFEKYKQTFDFFNASTPNPKAFKAFIMKQTTSFFVAGNLPPDYIEIIKEKYPYMILKEYGFTYSLYCFSKQKTNEFHETVVFTDINNFQNKSKYWLGDTMSVVRNDSSRLVYKMDSTIEYSPVFQAKLKEITDSKHNIINIKTIIYSSDSTSNPVLVMNIQNADTSLHWNGADYFWFNNKPGKNAVYISECLSGFNFKKYPEAEIKIYVWNRNKKSFYIENISIEVIKSNPFIYSLYHPIE
ncbi:MAG: glycosyltransferase family 39 protein [Bacteroidota bacterium]